MALLYYSYICNECNGISSSHSVKRSRRCDPPLSVGCPCLGRFAASRNELVYLACPLLVTCLQTLVPMFSLYLVLARISRHISSWFTDHCCSTQCLYRSLALTPTTHISSERFFFFFFLLFFQSQAAILPQARRARREARAPHRRIATSTTSAHRRARNIERCFSFCPIRRRFRDRNPDSHWSSDTDHFIHTSPQLNYVSPRIAPPVQLRCVHVERIRSYLLYA